MLDALDRDAIEPYSEEEVMSESIPSERGKGLFSSISKGDITLVDPEHHWPEPGKPVEVRVTRPINAKRTCIANVYNEKHESLSQVTIGNKRGTADRYNGTYIYKVHHSQVLDKCKELIIICTWGNSINKEVSCDLKLVR